MENKKIGRFISDCRKSIGLTQNELAEQLSVSNKTVSKWETGEGYPDITTIPKICFVLNITADEFFEGSYKSIPNGYISCPDEPSIFEEIISQTKLLWDSKFFILIYALYIISAYYIVPFNMSYDYPGFNLLMWLYIGIPICNVLSGAVHTVKYSLSVKYSLVSGLTGLFIIPVVDEYYEWTTFLTLGLLAVVLYTASTLYGSIFVLNLKNKYRMKFIFERKESSNKKVYSRAYLKGQEN